jgi:hypothetical protein
LKYLQKDRNRRCRSPINLQRTLQRYLQHQPVLATPASFFLWAAQVAGRKRACYAICGLVAVLVAQTVVSLHKGCVHARPSALPFSSQTVQFWGRICEAEGKLTGAEAMQKDVLERTLQNDQGDATALFFDREHLAECL